MMREGVHPETPKLPFTPGWDLVGVVDRHWLLPGRKRVVPYSIQTLMRLIAQRFPVTEAKRAPELLGKGGVTGRFVLVSDGSSLEARAV